MDTDSLELDDARGVSPVIGVILMVAITVILAAVIGTFVFSLADQSQEAMPNAQITITDIDTTNNTVTFAHNGGDQFTEDNTEAIRVTAGGDLVQEFTGSDVSFQAGDEKTASGGSIDSGDTVRIAWVGEDRSNVIAVREA